MLLLGLAWMTEWTAADLESFKRESMDYCVCDPPRDYTDYTAEYCNYIMKARGLDSKQSNTFVHLSMERFKSICTEEGVLDADIKTSNDVVPMTNCFTLEHLFPNSTGNSNTVYSNYGATNFQGFVKIECENGAPSKLVGYNMLFG